VKVKVKVAILVIARNQKRFTISEVAADWHELMITIVIDGRDSMVGTTFRPVAHLEISS